MNRAHVASEGTEPRWLRRHLLADGGLQLLADARLAAAIDRWLPRFPAAGATSERADGMGANIRLKAGDTPLRPPPTSPATLRLASVSAWVMDDTVVLRGTDDRTGGEIALASLSARLQAPVAATGPADPGLVAFTLLSISSALLLARSGRALLHSAAVVAPSGGAWLLIGDTHSGKTTTTLNLVIAGHGFLSDDHVVIRRRTATGEPLVEGWPRIFHVDEGWMRGEITGRRVDFDPATLPPERWQRTTPLDGLLFPTVEPDLPTSMVPLTPADALARMVRQSPWFLADRAGAPAVLDLLRDAARCPAFALRLGRDSYADPAHLDRCLAGLDGLRTRNR